MLTFYSENERFLSIYIYQTQCNSVSFHIPKPDVPEVLWDYGMIQGKRSTWLFKIHFCSRFQNKKNIGFSSLFSCLSLSCTQLHIQLITRVYLVLLGTFGRNGGRLGIVHPTSCYRSRMCRTSTFSMHRLRFVLIAQGLLLPFLNVCIIQ